MLPMLADASKQARAKCLCEYLEIQLKAGPSVAKPCVHTDIGHIMHSGSCVTCFALRATMSPLRFTALDAAWRQICLLCHVGTSLLHCRLFGTGPHTALRNTAPLRPAHACPVRNNHSLLHWVNLTAQLQLVYSRQMAQRHAHPRAPHVILDKMPGLGGSSGAMNCVCSWSATVPALPVSSGGSVTVNSDVSGAPSTGAVPARTW